MNIKTTISENYELGDLYLTYDTNDDTITIESDQETDYPNMVRIKKPLLKQLKILIEQLEKRIDC